MERRRRSILNNLIYVAILLIACWIGYVIINGSAGIVNRKNLDREIGLLEIEIDELKKEIEMADIQIKNLRDNKRYIEGFARELGYKKEGEVLFKFVERKPRNQ